MDGNKEEAARCIELAKSALASGDVERALKYIKIGQRLDNIIQVDVLLAACERLQNSNNRTHKEEIPVDQVREEPTSSKAAETSNGGRGYTEEHVRLIQGIKRNKDYYTILGVEKNCSVEEIRKAYRKLSLKVHPDKNKAPGAEEAFKSVSKAFKCLSDAESRQNYDQMGLVEDYEYSQQHNNMSRRRRRATRADFFDEDLDPDEIFRSFFFGTQGDVFRAQRVYRTGRMGRQQREHNDQVGGGFNLITLLQLLPILLFFLFALLPSSEPQYSLQKTYTHQMSKVTEKHGVEYFVKLEDFDQKFPEGSSARYDLEHNVLRDYKSVLGQYCHMELQRRHWMRTYPTPHCDKLRSLGVA